MAASEPAPSKGAWAVAAVRRAKISLRDVCTVGCRARAGGGHLSCQPRPQSLASGAPLQTGSGTCAATAAVLHLRLRSRLPSPGMCVGHSWRFVARLAAGCPAAPCLRATFWLSSALGAPHPMLLGGGSAVWAVGPRPIPGDLASARLFPALWSSAGVLIVAVQVKRAHP